jgi:hypothetical protein
VLAFVLCTFACTDAFAGYFYGLTDNNPSSSLWLIPRYSYGNLGYSTDNRDTGFEGSDSVNTDLASVELLFRPSHYGKSSIRFWGSINFEFVRQVIFDNSYIAPNANARLFFTAGQIAGRGSELLFGGVIQVGYGRYTLLNVTNTDSFSVDSVFRKNWGGGVVATYVSKKGHAQYTLIGLVTKASGGETPIIPNALMDTFNFEGSLGMSYLLTNYFSLEVRGRWMKTNYQWAPLNQDSTPSTFGTSFLLIDAGIGLKF